MRLPALPVGLRHQKSLTVDDGLTVPGLPPVMGDFRDFPAVLATPYLISFAEGVCIEAVTPFLEDGQMTVGIHVDMSHLAALPVGASLIAEVELVAVEGRRLKFRVTCRNGHQVVSQGFHERAVVDRRKFLAGLPRPSV